MGRLALVLVLTLLAAFTTATAASAAPRTPAQCAKALNCGADEIDLMSMSQRLEFVQAMERGPGAKFGAQTRWRNIEGVITFFGDHSWGNTPGSWVSYVDAGIVEGIERGLAIALGRKGGDFGNPGSQLWADYVTRLKSGQLRSRAAHDRAWGEAEQASTDHGVYLAEVVHSTPPSEVEKRFYDFSQLYRTIMRNKDEAANVVELYGVMAARPEVAYRSDNFVDWFTDVGNIVPSRKGCEMSWRFATLDIFGGIAGAVDIFFTALPDLLGQYFADQQKAAARQVARPSGRQLVPSGRQVEIPQMRKAGSRVRPVTPSELRRAAPHIARDLSRIAAASPTR